MAWHNSIPNPMTYLPMGVRVFLRHRSQELSGIVLLLTALFVVLSLATWSATDPSVNNATSDLPTNLMGYAGAIIADLFFQTIGLGTLALIPPLAVWGARLLQHNPIDRGFLRTATWAASCLTGSLFCAGFTAPESWPLLTGLGGVGGDALAYVTVEPLTSLLGSQGAWFIALLLTGIATLYFMVFASDLHSQDLTDAYDRFMDWRDDRREAKATARQARPDVEPSALRILYYRTSDAVTGAFAGLIDRLRNRTSDEEFNENYNEGPEEEWMDDDEGAEEAVDLEEEEPSHKRSFGRRVERTTQEEEATPRQSRAARRRLAAQEAAEAAEAEEVERPRNRVRVSRSNTKTKTSKRAQKERQPSLKFGQDEEYELPPLGLLTSPKKRDSTEVLSDEALEQNARLLEKVLDDFGIRGEIINVRPGPVVTLYELAPAPGIKSSRVIALADDIARSMSAISARIAVVPGRNVIGIELPNSKREMVFFRELISSSEYENTNTSLSLALGKNIGGDAVISDLARMPHLLIAGTTGSGKSVGINTMILSLLYRLSPEKCKLIMIDPKMLELSVYEGIPHLLAPVVTDPKKAVIALKWVVKEMEDRYRKMSKLSVRNIAGFNDRVEEAIENDEVIIRTVQTGFDKETGEAIYEEEEMDLEPLPFIVVIIDEMADLMMVAGKEIEATVQRLAQMARAAGIHMITATQRPSVDVITGTIKANFPTRISFQVTSKIDSRTILGEQGAEQLLGQGDMLYMAGGGRISRVHGAFVSDNEVEKVVKFLKKQGMPQYIQDVTEGGEDEEAVGHGESSAPTDALYDEAVAIVGRDKRASTSYIQRKLQIGYNRAARIIEQMEEEGVVSAPNHAGKREVLIGEPGEGIKY
ncbi:MAG: DNA translocase FtsK 4TM domain-containing protein [Parvibaculaceae bacterium]|nr:DNA translocase FtsK 4TM domain-containing protein [Parvibaculaceae bacterium]